MSNISENGNSELLPIEAGDIPVDESDATTLVESIDNPYSPLVDEARDNILRIMHNTENEKLSKEISLEILDRAGEKKADASAQVMVNVNITDDDVKIMMAAASEVRKE